MIHHEVTHMLGKKGGGGEGKEANSKEARVSGDHLIYFGRGGGGGV